MSDKKLAAKLVEIIKDLPMIEKKGRNDFHHYNYAMEVDFLEAVRPKLTERGILMSMSVDTIQITEKEKDGRITTIKTTHTFIDSETGETLVFHGAGQGEDKGDKGIYKAQTGALKYALAKFFLISTGDDPEAYNQKRMEAGKVTKRARGQEPPPPPPPHTEAPPDKLKNGNHVPPNPWHGKLETLTGPFSGEYKGKPWTRWDISTGSMNLATFDKGVADVAGVAIADGVPVELVWILKRSAKTGEEKCLAESIRILDPDEVGMQTSRAAAY